MVAVGDDGPPLPGVYGLRCHAPSDAGVDEATHGDDEVLDTPKRRESSEGKEAKEVAFRFLVSAEGAQPASIDQGIHGP